MFDGYLPNHLPKNQSGKPDPQDLRNRTISQGLVRIQYHTCCNPSNRFFNYPKQPWAEMGKHRALAIEAAKAEGAYLLFCFAPTCVAAAKWTRVGHHICTLTLFQASAASQPVPHQNPKAYSRNGQDNVSFARPPSPVFRPQSSPLSPFTFHLPPFT